MSSKNALSKKNIPLKRSLSRLACVQALYEIDLSDNDPKKIIDTYLLTYSKLISSAKKEKNIEDAVNLDRMDIIFFNNLIRGVIDDIVQIDLLIEKNLTEQWPMNRLEVIVKSILRCGIAELLLFNKTPSNVIITEYLEIANAYYHGNEVKLINAMLDKVSQLIRKNK